MSTPHVLAGELVQLVRHLRDLHVTVTAESGHALELPAAALLSRLGDEGPQRPSVLAERLLVDLSTLSRQAATLERRGWLSREADPGDRRAQLLRLTAEGERVLADVREARARALARVLPGWSEQELADLAAQLHRLNGDLSAHRPARTAALPSAAQEAS